MIRFSHATHSVICLTEARNQMKHAWNNKNMKMRCNRQFLSAQDTGTLLRPGATDKKFETLKKKLHTDDECVFACFVIHV